MTSRSGNAVDVYSWFFCFLLDKLLSYLLVLVEVATTIDRYSGILGTICALTSVDGLKEAEEHPRPKVTNSESLFSLVICNRHHDCSDSFPDLVQVVQWGL